MQFAQIAAGFFGVDSRSVFLYNRKQSPHAIAPADLSKSSTILLSGRRASQERKGGFS